MTKEIGIEYSVGIIKGVSNSIPTLYPRYLFRVHTNGARFDKWAVLAIRASTKPAARSNLRFRRFGGLRPPTSGRTSADTFQTSNIGPDVKFAN